MAERLSAGIHHRAVRRFSRLRGASCVLPSGL